MYTVTKQNSPWKTTITGELGPFPFGRVWKSEGSTRNAFSSCFIASLRQQVAAWLAVARRGARIAASIWSATAVEGATLTLRQSPWHAAVLGYMYEASAPTNTTTAAAAARTTTKQSQKIQTQENTDTDKEEKRAHTTTKPEGNGHKGVSK